MPWECPQCRAQVVDQRHACPSCGRQKTSWSLHQSRTRTFTLARSKMECTRGEGADAVAQGPTPYDWVDWQATEVAAAVDGGLVRALAARQQLPAPHDLLLVRVALGRGRDPTVQVVVNRERQVAAEHALTPEDRDELGFDLPVLCVVGDTGGATLPGVALLDVADPDAPEGCAPTLDVAAARKPPRRIRLERRRRLVHLLELEDLGFHTDSAVMLPDLGPDEPAPDQDRIAGLEVVRTAIQFAELHPDKRLLVAGHTDTAGSASHNAELSRLRADNVHAYLRGDRDRWARLCQQRFVVKDWQQVLAWVARTKGWDTDPGKVDGISGDKSRGALRRFRKAWSAERPAEAIPEAGPLAERDWRAFYALYDEELARLFSCPPDGLAARRGALGYLDPAAVGCGESWPVDRVGVDGHASKANRRVELLFFDPGEEPALDCHAGGGCDPARCELYGQGGPARYRAEYLPREVRAFRFALPVGEGLPWTDAGALRIASEDGAEERLFPLAAGTPLGASGLRSFLFPDARPGVRYLGEVVEDDLRAPLFAPCELFRIQDPQDALVLLPLPPGPAPEEELPPHPVGPVAVDPGPDEHPAFADRAADPFTASLEA